MEIDDIITSVLADRGNPITFEEAKNVITDILDTNKAIGSKKEKLNKIDTIIESYVSSKEGS